MLLEWKVLVSAAQKAKREDDYKETERLFWSALEYAEEFGHNNMQLLFTLEGLAETLWLSGKYSQAAAICKRLLVAYIEKSSVDHIDVGYMAQNLALIYHQWNKTPEAERFYRLAVQVLGLQLGTRNKRFIGVLEAYTKLLSTTNRRNDARLLRSYVEQRVPGRWTKSGSWESYDKKQCSYEAGEAPSFERVAVLPAALAMAVT